MLKLKEAAVGHLKRAYELFQNIEKEHDWVAGFILKDMMKYTNSLIEETSQFVDLGLKKNTVLFPPLIPGKDEK